MTSAGRSKSVRLDAEIQSGIDDFARRNRCNDSIAIRLLLQRALETRSEAHAEAREGILLGHRLFLVLTAEASRWIARQGEKLKWEPEAMGEIEANIRQMFSAD